MSRRRSLDAELIRRSLAPTSEEARLLIAAGRVRVGGSIADKASRQVDPSEAVEVVAAGPRFVSRGGEKLAAALELFGIDVTGKRVIDVGSSTGGFTDCVLQAGARAVVAIDVGRNQLHEQLRADQRVAVHEQTNVRGVDPTEIGGPGDLVVADLSFISIRRVAVALLGLTKPDGSIVVLVKPQFEALKVEADRVQGVIRDPFIWQRTLTEVGSSLEGCGAAIMGVMVSPLTGADGNVEFLMHARPGGEPTPAELGGWIRNAVIEAEDR